MYLNDRVLTLDTRRQALLLDVDDEISRLHGTGHRECDVDFSNRLLLPFVGQGHLFGLLFGASCLVLGASCLVLGASCGVFVGRASCQLWPWDTNTWYSECS